MRGRRAVPATHTRLSAPACPAPACPAAGGHRPGAAREHPPRRPRPLHPPRRRAPHRRRQRRRRRHRAPVRPGSREPSVMQETWMDGIRNSPCRHAATVLFGRSRSASSADEGHFALQQRRVRFAEEQETVQSRPQDNTARQERDSKCSPVTRAAPGRTIRRVKRVEECQ